MGNVLLSLESLPLQAKHQTNTPAITMNTTPTTTPIIVDRENIEAEFDALPDSTEADGVAVGDGTGDDWIELKVTLDTTADDSIVVP